jgi:hypothetical protein
MTRNDIEGISLSQSWSFVMTSFINPYLEVIFLDSVYFRGKMHFTPIELEPLKVTTTKDFRLGPLCLELTSRYIIL